MQVRINGETKELQTSLNLSDLLQSLHLKPAGIAIELNKEVVSKDRWPETTLQNGDTLEIVHFVGGGN